MYHLRIFNIYCIFPDDYHTSSNRRNRLVLMTQRVLKTVGFCYRQYGKYVKYAEVVRLMWKYYVYYCPVGVRLSGDCVAPVVQLLMLIMWYRGLLTLSLRHNQYACLSWWRWYSVTTTMHTIDNDNKAVNVDHWMIWLSYFVITA